MMRLTRGALQLLAFSLRASAATASAEGVWVLWEAHGVRFRPAADVRLGVAQNAERHPIRRRPQQSPLGQSVSERAGGRRTYAGHQARCR